MPMLTNRSALATLLLMVALAAPVAAHKKHHPEPANTAVPVAAGQGPRAAASSQATHAAPMAGHHETSPLMRDDDDRSTMTFAERLLDWLGRLHVSVIHFPLAFFPAALVAAAVGRRRPGFARPVQFLIIAGGVTASIAAVLGWLNGGLVLRDADGLLFVHRWLGTAIALSGLGLAAWAWKRPGADRGTAMLLALGVITAALLVQGWFGGSMIHGVDHMNW